VLLRIDLLFQPVGIQIDGQQELVQLAGSEDARLLVAVVGLGQEPQLDTVRAALRRMEGGPGAAALAVAARDVEPVPVGGERERLEHAPHRLAAGLVANFVGEDREDGVAIEKQVRLGALHVGGQGDLLRHLPERLQLRLREPVFFQAPLRDAAHRHRAQRRVRSVQREVVASHVAAVERIDVGSAHFRIESMTPEDAGAGNDIAVRHSEARLHRRAAEHFRAEAVGDDGARADSVELRRARGAADLKLASDADQQVALEQAAFQEQGVHVAGGAVVVERRPEREPGPPARRDPHVLQPVIAVAACEEREALVDGRLLVAAVADVGARVEEGGRGAVGARGAGSEEGENQDFTE